MTVTRHDRSQRSVDAFRAVLREVAGDPQPDSPAVLLDLHWDAEFDRLPPARQPILPVYGIGGRLVVGPLIEPGRPGCPHCLILRVRIGGAATAGWRPLSADPAPQWWPVNAAYLVGEVLLDESARWSRGATPRSRDAAYVFDAGGSAAAWRPAIPNALCLTPHCVAAAPALPPPLPDLATGLPATEPGSTRRHPAGAFAARLESGYVDAWSGVVRAPGLAGDAALPSVQVKVPTAWGFEEVAIGRADDFVTARAAAVLEGLERYAGWHCGGRDPDVVAAFGDLADAVDPRSLLLHEEYAYGRPGFEYIPFDTGTPVAWARAYSVHTGSPVHLPFHVAYYGATQRPEVGPSFVYENSNGCALGSGVEEALLAGLLEVAERDAFLTAWYSATPLPELDLAALEPAPAAAVRSLRLRTGRAARAFLAVGAFGVPVVVLVTTSEKPDEPRTLVTAGSGLTVSRALGGAVQEMAAAAPAITLMYGQRHDGLEAALTEPELVRQMTDHALVAALPGARDRFAFLLDGPRTAGTGAPLHQARGDVAADLAGLLAAAAVDGQQVYAVDHTTIELSRAGLRCVKVVVPGTAPMTFGHLHRRMPAAESVRRFRARNGAPPSDGDKELRHVPHPFP